MTTEISRRSPVARKVHRCFWCAEDIVPGEKYVSAAHADCGTVFKVKLHQECDKAWQHAANENGGEYYTEDHQHYRGCDCHRSYREGCTCKKAEPPTT